MPEGLTGKALALKNGLALRALSQFDIANGAECLRFDVLYSKK